MSTVGWVAIGFVAWVVIVAGILRVWSKMEH